MVQHDFFLAVPAKATARTRCGVRAKRWPYAYSAPSYKEWLKEALPALKKLAPTLPEDVQERDVHIDVEARIRKPKTTKLKRPRGDNDNYEKGLWDAMTKVGAWWKDDVQIVKNCTTKTWVGPDEPEGYQVVVSFLDPEE